MVNEQIPQFSVSDFLAVVNQSLEMAFGLVEIEGEVSSFKVNHQKYVFFDLKDAEGSVGCFMMAYQLRVPIEDGMRVIVRAVPKVTNWGKFSLTVQAIRPMGEGSIKKSFELLKEKLAKEGLFDDSRKRPLPERPRRVAVVSSMQAAGYADFVKIANQRLGGTEFFVYHVRVQGESAADEIITAIEQVNQVSEPYEVAVIIRGGGSADDLSVFNDEKLVRAIAGSRTPILTGIGHEVDETLADFAADVRASTPSSAAYNLLPDKQVVLAEVDGCERRATGRLVEVCESYRLEAEQIVKRCQSAARTQIDLARNRLSGVLALVESYNPEAVLARGYALVRGEIKIGQMIDITTSKHNIKAEVKQYGKR